MFVRRGVQHIYADRRRDRRIEMSKDRFAEILREYGYTKDEIDILWNSRPPEEIDEGRLREAAKDIAPIKHRQDIDI